LIIFLEMNIFHWFIECQFDTLAHYLGFSIAMLLTNQYDKLLYYKFDMNQLYKELKNYKK